jgi:hypothetical protein
MRHAEQGSQLECFRVSNECQWTVTSAREKLRLIRMVLVPQSNTCDNLGHIGKTTHENACRTVDETHATRPSFRPN